MEETLRTEIERKVEDAITNVFLMIQKDQGIRTGDCPPLLAYDLEKKTDALIDTVSDIIQFQMEHCK